MNEPEYVDKFYKRIERYSNGLVHSDYGSNHHLPKEFVRIDDNTDKRNTRLKCNSLTSKKTVKDSLLFGNLFRSLMSKDNHYITYLNNSFNCKKSELVIPEHVSCLIKNFSDIGADRCFFECVGSRLANLLGVDTVYNIALCTEKDEELDYTEYNLLLSVDYVPYGYRTETLQELGIQFNEDTPLSTIMKNIDANLPKIAKQENIQLTNKMIEDIKTSMAKQFLYRALVCEDYDFEAKNFSLLIGESDMRMGPTYDMELLFDGAKSQAYYEAMTNNAFEYMFQNMPSALDEFMSRLQEKHKNGDISHVVTHALNVPSNWSRRINKQLDKNCERLETLYSQMQSSHEM